MQRVIIATITGLLAVTLAGTTFAQAPTATAPSPQARRHAVLKALDLTADQKAQVKAILQQARTEAQSATDMQARHLIRQAAFQKIRETVLTDQQRTKMAQLHRAQMRRAMFGQLNLTVDQKAQVKSIMQQARAAAQGATDVNAKHQIWKDAFAKVKDTVLTDQQRTHLAELQAQRAAHAPCSKPAANL